MLRSAENVCFKHAVNAKFVGEEVGPYKYLIQYIHPRNNLTPKVVS